MMKQAIDWDEAPSHASTWCWDQKTNRAYWLCQPVMINTTTLEDVGNNKRSEAVAMAGGVLDAKPFGREPGDPTETHQRPC